MTEPADEPGTRVRLKSRRPAGSRRPPGAAGKLAAAVSALWRRTVIIGALSVVVLGVPTLIVTAARGKVPVVGLLLSGALLFSVLWLLFVAPS